MKLQDKHWAFLAFVLVAFIFVLHGTWSRTESFAVPGIGNLGLNASVGGQKGKSNA